MKLRNAFILCLILTSLYSCEEKYDGVDLTPPPPASRSIQLDTTTIDTVSSSNYPLNVLLEDFTGGDCINCPSGHMISEQLITANPGRVSVIAIHSFDGALGSIAKPYEKAKYDFRTHYGTELGKLFQVNSLPQAGINRKQHAGEPKIAVESRGNWTAYTNLELKKTTPVKIELLSNSFNDADSLMSIRFKVKFSADIPQELYASVYIIETGIVDYQKTLTVVKSDYVHNHIFRKAIYPETGLALPKDIKKGTAFLLSAKTHFNPNWKSEKCHCVIVVHERSSTKYDVHQVIEFDVK